MVILVAFMIKLLKRAVTNCETQQHIGTICTTSQLDATVIGRYPSVPAEEDSTFKKNFMATLKDEEYFR
ncbi:MAG: hypothetical protein CMQ41_03185 [Gammaproteobacteria bacterium]|nr:hypothetical protein [Gammaproteobacteria bacterium]